MVEAANPDFRHATPDDLKTILEADSALRAKWEDLTPLARNEWICWTISPKKEETRAKHLDRLQAEVRAGKRRPCCWPGCPHRNANARKWVEA